MEQNKQHEKAPGFWRFCFLAIAWLKQNTSSKQKVRIKLQVFWKYLAYIM
ncbi:hypothetical protein QUF84_26750 [Fictibacillus enclensis]|nr:hypothetical protein [Fictibacillus enclensis]MDM5340794.1 hypothetical protein [Fictibacillus enclensis]